MDYQTFIQKIRELTAEALGSAYRVELSAVPKNNGVMMDAIMIFREEENIAPTIYLRPCYESYRQHQSVRDSVKEIVDRYFCSLPKSWTGFTEFTDPDRVRDRIVFRLINYEKNRELLAGWKTGIWMSRSLRRLPGRIHSVCFHTASCLCRN